MSSSVPGGSAPAGTPSSGAAASVDVGTDPADRPQPPVAPRWLAPVVVALVLFPLAVLVGSLATRTWYPTGDQAQAELRMLSLPEHPPLVGQAGRIVGDDGQQGNHPGPLMYWVPWPLYAILGGSSWAYEAATAAVAGLGLAASVLLVRSRAGPGVTLWYGAVTIALVGGYGLDVLSQPWNPWVALVPFTLVVLSTWLVVDGARWPLVLAVGAGSYAIQGHAGYVPLVPPLVLVAVGALVWRERPRSRAELPAALRRLVAVPVAAVVGLVAWSGPTVDALTNEPSNLDILLQHFGSPEEAPIGLGAGIEAVLRGLDPFGPWVRGDMVLDGSIVPGLLLVVAWAAVAGGVAVRRVAPSLTRLNAVIALTLVLAVVAVSRVFGAVYLYTFRWIVAVVALLVFAVGWGSVALLGGRRELVPRARALAVGVAVVALLSGATAVRISRQDIPYGHASVTTAALARQAAATLDPDETYLLRWEDPVYLGGPAYGLLLALERDGFTVGVDPPNRAAAEPRRVLCPDEATALLTVVSGAATISSWEERSDATEVARTDPRSADAQAAGAADRRELAARLGITPEEVDGRLTSIVLGTDSPPEVVEIASRLVDAGLPTAVFESEVPPADQPCSAG